MFGIAQKIWGWGGKIWGGGVVAQIFRGQAAKML